jgi:hypothetical protein
MPEAERRARQRGEPAKLIDRTLRRVVQMLASVWAARVIMANLAGRLWRSD